MMRKILSSLMILLLLALFAATYVSSSRTEEAFRTQVEQLNLNYAGLLQVELLEYRRGLLVSEVKTRLTLRRDSLPLQHQIRHFPWKVRVLTGVAEESPAAAGLAQRLPLEQLQLQTDVGLDGSSQSRFALAELNFSDQNAELQLRGLSFACDLDGQQSGGVLNLKLDSFRVSEPGQAELLISAMQINSRFSEQQGLPIGSGQAQLGQVSLQQQNQPGFELNELRYQLSSSLENDQLASLLELQLGSLLLGGESFSDGKLQLQLAGIDAAALRDLQASARQMQAASAGQQVDPLIQQLQLLGLYSQFFETGLTVSLQQLALRTDRGELLGKGEVILQDLNLTGGNGFTFDQLNGQLQLDIDLPFFQAGFRLVNNLKHQGRGINPAVLNEQAEQLAGGLIQKGIFTRREDGGFQLKLSIEQGQAELNGQPFRW